jgi:hypothetical protein
VLDKYEEEYGGGCGCDDDDDDIDIKYMSLHIMNVELIVIENYLLGCNPV